MPNLICDNDVHYSIEIVLYNNYLDAKTTINEREKMSYYYFIAVN